MKKFGYLIINYNDYETTNKLIDNIKDYKIIDEIVVIDNNSNDNSKEELKKNKNITLICNDENLGFAKAINIGCKYLIDKYDKVYIAISNSDIRIKKEKDLKDLLDSFKNDIAIVAPTIKEPKEIVKGWKLTSVKEDIKLNIPLINRKYRKKLMTYPEEHYKSDVSYVDIVKGCFFIIDSQALINVNYFDENTFLYYEENIIAKKLRVKGYKTIINNNVLIYHDHEVSINKNISNVNKYKITKDSFMYYEKNYNGASNFQLFILKVLNNMNLIAKKIRKK
ncbi:MAG: glycosyltransferase [Firmicutes bacterium]|nr:glycosyltransferase [Bacillota bacterium]